VFKGKKTFLVVLIFVYGLSAAICSSDFNGMVGHAGNDHFPNIYCGIDLNNYVPLENPSSSLIDLTPCWGLLHQINEPHLPILSFPIFKVPKPA
jgi:hypothetical protein